MIKPIAVTLLGLLAVHTTAADVVTTVFFTVNQVATLVSTGTTSDTISSEGYEFTYTRDKLFTGGIGTNPIGRTVRVPWPDGVEAQYVTAGPQPEKARITIRRVDGAVFDLTSFTAKLLANAGAGRAIEIVPLLNGEEPLADPLYFDVSGSYGMSFSYNTSANHLGSTAALTNYDTYVVNLTLDYALTALTLKAVVPHTNHPPTDVALSHASIPENEPVGTWMGGFSTTDPDGGDTFTYTLVGGAGSADNAAFSILDGELYAEASFNFEYQSHYSIRVESADQDGLSTQKVFSIQVLDVVEAAPTTEIILPPEGGVVIQWDSVANHSYTLLSGTNLMSEFTVLASNLPATPSINSYTDSTPATAQRFWKITTEP